MTEQKIEPCPMPGCGGECTTRGQEFGKWFEYQVVCNDVTGACGYRSAWCFDDAEIGSNERTGDANAIAAHNELCRLVRVGKRTEKVIDKPPEHPLEGEDTEYQNGLSDGFANGVKAMRDMLTCADERSKEPEE